MTLETSPLAVYERLLAHYGPQDWWPADTPFEVMVGAILTQNTAWRNVERAIQNLKEADALSLAAIEGLRLEELEERIRPAGYFRQKARRLKTLTHFISEHHGGDVEAFLQVPADTLRNTLLSLNGIGPETADTILLYAAQYGEFVIDTYTARVFKRHAWVDPEANYDQLKEFFHDSLPLEAPLFNEYHALIVRVGKEHCQPTPKCHGCPLEPFLPPGGLPTEFGW